MRAAHGHDHRYLADGELPCAVQSGQPAPGLPGGHSLRHLSEPGRGAGMRLVVEPDDGPAPVGVPDRPDKHSLAPGGGSTDGIEALLHGQ